MGKQEYKPVSCDFYDILENLSVQKESCKVTFRTAEGQELTETGLIQDLYTKEKVEYLSLDNGSEIRLDSITGVEKTAS